MPDPEFKIPTGYSAPFAVVTDSDHTAWLLIATALGLCLILLEQDHTYSWVPSTGAAAAMVLCQDRLTVTASVWTAMTVGRLS